MFMRLYAKSVASVHFNIVRQSLFVFFIMKDFKTNTNSQANHPNDLKLMFISNEVKLVISHQKCEILHASLPPKLKVLGKGNYALM